MSPFKAEIPALRHGFRVDDNFKHHEAVAGQKFSSGTFASS